MFKLIRKVTVAEYLLLFFLSAFVAVGIYYSVYGTIIILFLIFCLLFLYKVLG
jgi:hypothetical protein